MITSVPAGVSLVRDLVGKFHSSSGYTSAQNAPSRCFSFGQPSGMGGPNLNVLTCPPQTPYACLRRRPRCDSTPWQTLYLFPEAFFPLLRTFFVLTSPLLTTFTSTCFRHPRSFLYGTPPVSPATLFCLSRLCHYGPGFGVQKFFLPLNSHFGRIFPLPFGFFVIDGDAFARRSRAAWPLRECFVTSSSISKDLCPPCLKSI